MYNTICECSFEVENKDPGLFTDEEINTLLTAIYLGYITEELLDVNMYIRISNNSFF